MAGYRKNSCLTCNDTKICSNIHSLLAGFHTHSSVAQNLQLYKYSVVNDICRYGNVHLFPQNVQTGSGVHPASSSIGTGGAFPSR